MQDQWDIWSMIIAVIVEKKPVSSVRVAISTRNDELSYPTLPPTFGCSDFSYTRSNLWHLV